MKDQEYDYFYDDEQDVKYCYPGTNVLKNKLNIRDLDILHEAERDYSSVRQAELTNKGVTGDFSFKHLCSIHKQLFQDINLGLERQELLIFPKAQFSAWYNSLKYSLIISIEI